MAKIILEGWNEGLEKISLTKLQNDLLNISLRDSKNNVDRLLDGEIIEIIEVDEKIAKLFVQKAIEIGAICKYE